VDDHLSGWINITCTVRYHLSLGWLWMLKHYHGHSSNIVYYLSNDSKLTNLELLLERNGENYISFRISDAKLTNSSIE